MKEISVDNEGNLCYEQLYTGLGPVAVQTYFEDAVYQAILNDPALQLFSHLSVN
ncbi:MAG: hypothetical protein AAGA66_13110 [Bacteroidota bacterium]